MTTKAEQESTAHPSEARSESSPEVSQSNGAGRALPTIIVDPSLSEPRPAALPAEGAGKSAGAGNEGTGASSEGTGTGGTADVAALRFSVEDAERFASSFRASWEPPAPDATPRPNGGPTRTEVSLAPAPVASVPAPEPDLQDIALPGRAKRRGLVLAGAAVVGFTLLVALGLMSSRVQRPEASAEAAPAAETPPPAALAKPVEPDAPAAPPVAPQPSALVASRVAGEAPPPSRPDPPSVAPAEPVAAPQPVAPPPSAPAPPAATAKAAPELVAPKPVEAPPAPKPPPAIHLRITTTPEDATLKVDGETVSNPFDAEVRKGGKHRVEASAAGHRNRDLSVTFDRDRTLALRLDKIAARRPKAAKRPAPIVHRPSSPVAPTPSSPKGAGFVTESPY